tara:strand:+ start:234 stop:392 length:159 start_codon:yes stop_codon:yes gene_type:complete
MELFDRTYLNHSWFSDAYAQFKLLQTFVTLGDIYFKQAGSMLDSKSNFEYFV